MLLDVTLQDKLRLGFYNFIYSLKVKSYFKTVAVEIYRSTCIMQFSKTLIN